MARYAFQMVSPIKDGKMSRMAKYAFLMVSPIKDGKMSRMANPINSS